jgi:hypothetical protein
MYFITTAHLIIFRPFTFADPREEKTSDSVGGIITEAVASERHSCLSDEL